MPKALCAHRLFCHAAAPVLLALSGCSGGGESKTTTPMADQPDIAGSQYIAAEAAPGKAMLASLIEPLFDGELPGQTRALVIMQGGRIVAERYADGFDADTKMVGWSLSKSITAVLVGILVTDGRLALDEPAPVPAWSSPGDLRGTITLRQLLNMSSGLDHTEALKAESNVAVYEGDTARMLYLDGSGDMAAYAERRPLEAAPGAKFEYSTSTTLILADIIARALTTSADPDIRRRHVREFAHGRLFEPLGLSSMTMEFDARGTMIGGSFIHGSARDWAKFGEFSAQQWARLPARRSYPAHGLRFMKAPAPANAAYGGHVWRNVERSDGGEQLLFPGIAPDSLIAGLGHYGQYLLISPDQRFDGGAPRHERNRDSARNHAPSGPDSGVVPGDWTAANALTKRFGQRRYDARLIGDIVRHHGPAILDRLRRFDTKAVERGGIKAVERADRRYRRRARRIESADRDLRRQPWFTALRRAPRLNDSPLGGSECSLKVRLAATMIGKGLINLSRQVGRQGRSGRRRRVGDFDIACQQLFNIGIAQFITPLLKRRRGRARRSAHRRTTASSWLSCRSIYA